MIDFQEALATILSQIVTVTPKRVSLERSAGHFLAEALLARADMPLFDNSAVDGFGVRLQDVAEASENSPSILQLHGTIQAGDPGFSELPANSALKILTGAIVPPCVEAVVMREFCQETDGTVSVARPCRAGENIRRRGEEFLRGQEILPAGVRITPPVVGLLATGGYAAVQVYDKPRAALITTGSELVKPGKDLAPGKIYESNSYALIAALRGLGLDSIKHYQAVDDKRATSEVLSAALKDADVIISTGGVSVGDYDFVKDCLEDLGVSTVFWKIAMKPGKPVFFGTRLSKKVSKQYVFGLPGNPVSALVTFHQLVRPALLKMMGSSACQSMLMEAVLKRDLKKAPGRLDFVRGTLASEDGKLVVTPVSGQDSHMLGGLAQADCLIYFDKDAAFLPEGAAVKVSLLDWGG